jgi:hypothetical protein
MTRNNLSANAIARASVQQQFLDARMARQHMSMAAFARELELVQERHEFGLATRHEVAQVEDQLIAAWRGLLELSSPSSEHSPKRHGASNGKHH